MSLTMADGDQSNNLFLGLRLSVHRFTNNSVKSSTVLKLLDVHRNTTQIHKQNHSGIDASAAVLIWPNILLQVKSSKRLVTLSSRNFLFPQVADRFPSNVTKWRKLTAPAENTSCCFCKDIWWLVSNSYHNMSKEHFHSVRWALLTVLNRSIQ